MRFQNILVAIDDSPLDSPVFGAALELAQSNKGAIKLFYCVTPERVSEPTIPMTLDPNLPMGLVNPNDYQSYETQQILLERQMEEAQAVLKRYSDQAISQGVPTELGYEVGDPGHELCRVAKEWGADLIVVGRRGRTGLTEALLGSVSNYVVHHAPCSVLVIQEVELEPLTEAIADETSLGINPASNQALA